MLSLHHAELSQSCTIECVSHLMSAHARSYVISLSLLPMQDLAILMLMPVSRLIARPMTSCKGKWLATNDWLFVWLVVPSSLFI